MNKNSHQNNESPNIHYHNNNLPVVGYGAFPVVNHNERNDIEEEVKKIKVTLPPVPLKEKISNKVWQIISNGRMQIDRANYNFGLFKNNLKKQIEQWIQNIKLSFDESKKLGQEIGRIVDNAIENLEAKRYIATDKEIFFNEMQYYEQELVKQAEYFEQELVKQAEYFEKKLLKLSEENEIFKKWNEDLQKKLKWKNATINSKNNFIKSAVKQNIELKQENKELRQENIGLKKWDEDLKRDLNLKNIGTNKDKQLIEGLTKENKELKQENEILLEKSQKLEQERKHVIEELIKIMKEFDIPLYKDWN